jgi:hypothetical protein
LVFNSATHSYEVTIIMPTKSTEILSWAAIIRITCKETAKNL